MIVSVVVELLHRLTRRPSSATTKESAEKVGVLHGSPVTVCELVHACCILLPF